VFKGPVHRTEKKTKIGLNWTGKDWTSSLFMDWSFAVQLEVFPFEKCCKTKENRFKPVRTGFIVGVHIGPCSHIKCGKFDLWFIKDR